jgi:hypothetical protein
MRRRLRRTASLEQEESIEGNGGWVGVVLFIVVLAASAALAGYTFARPFIPVQWLP